MIRLTALLFSLLPLRLNHAIGALLGWLVWLLPAAPRRTTIANLARCFPEESEGWRRRIARTSMVESGKALTEAPWLWRAGREGRLGALLHSNPEAEAIIGAAVAEGRGVIFSSPHLGSWEFAGLDLAARGPLSILYRPPRRASLEGLLIEGRGAAGAGLIPADRSALRKMVRTLEEGHLLGILPDQVPKVGAGVDAPFFGQPVSTMTLLARLARRHAVPVVTGFVRRLPQGGGYRYEVERLGDEIYSEDETVAATALNRAIERCVRSCPEQYAWSYKRFTSPPR